MEQLKHECGVAMIRLLKPLEYYEKKYGTWMYGLNKLYLLMEKQHNRGQEGAGLACVKLEANPGEEYMFRERALGSGAITEIFETVQSNFKDLSKEQLHDAAFAKRTLPFAGEAYMGHLRYSTTGKSGISYVHPFLRRNNWRAKNLALCGNFNMTNVDEIFARITAIGQHPRKYADTYIMLEQVGHRLDREVERLFNLAEAEGLTGMGVTHYIEDHIDLANVLRTSSKEWDGGYVMCGLTGSGESFALRDPWGIRPAFWYQDDEIAVLASERPVIQTALNVPIGEIRELLPGQALLISKEGKLRTAQINKAREKKACSFERIYFSRGSDADIYKERKQLGEKLVPNILKAIDNDLDHTVFSFIPNTAEVAFYGMLQGLDNYLNEEKVRQIASLGHHPDHDELEVILSRRIRSEKVAIKDIKLRTFIAEGNSRNDLAAHVYDITYGSLRSGIDNLVIIDDSIVRGTTLKQSIIGILDRLGPKKIVIVSSSPQVRYPDYYGIDMAKMSEFIAFKAAIELLKDRDMKDVIASAYRKSKDQVGLPKEQMVNYVKDIYAPFTDEEISGHHPDHDELEVILSRRIRSEKVAIKDIKLRTFIAEGNSRNDLAAHVYDITYGSLRSGIDNLVIIDDSIVRGTTLKQSIIGILDRLGPKKIVIVSSSPQVRYPDYYGIDMAKMSEFIAFKAAIELLKDRDMKDVIASAYRKSKDQVGLPKEQMVNYVKDIYAPFTDEEISEKMVELLTPKGTKAKVQIVYQPLEGLHEACPNHTGDWYFSGNYPTPGGVKLLNEAFINYIEQVYQF